jgi:hypothetical protein
MYEDSNLKTDSQISEDLKNRLSCNHYIKCFCFNQNVANKNINIYEFCVAMNFSEKVSVK